MRLLPRFLDEYLPYLDIPGCPCTRILSPDHFARQHFIANRPESEIPIAWWPRAERYTER